MMADIGNYPQRRMRRNRDGHNIRDMLAETHLSTKHLIWPVFIMEGQGVKTSIASMPGIERISIDHLPVLVEWAEKMGIPALALFPYSPQAVKTRNCQEAVNPDNLICRAVRHVRQYSKDIMLLCDVALDPYNLDGHDGLYIIDETHKEGGYIANDATLEILVQQALTLAEAGADCLGPSDMMDGRIGAIRNGLDKQGFQQVRLIAYAAKYASAFYGPFRDAVGSGAHLKGDKKSYQINPTNREEALHEVALDLKEGADIVMIKPGMPYLDIISAVKDQFKVPVFAYQVSGEYAMLMSAIQAGFLDHDAAILEAMTAFRRAGASAILSYFSPKIAEILQEQHR